MIVFGDPMDVFVDFALGDIVVFDRKVIKILGRFFWAFFVQRSEFFIDLARRRA